MFGNKYAGSLLFVTLYPKSGAGTSVNQDLRRTIEYISREELEKKEYLKYILSVSTIIITITRKQSYKSNENMNPSIVVKLLCPWQPHFPLEKPPQNYDLAKKPSNFHT